MISMSKLISTSIFSKRKKQNYEMIEKNASKRDYWIARNNYFYDQEKRYLKYLIPEGLSVLDMGCGTGDLLDSLKPSYGLGIDFSPTMIKIAREKYNKYYFYNEDVENANFIKTIQKKFDVILLSDTIGYLDDCQEFLESIHHLCHENTRIIIAYHSKLWEPILRIAEILGRKMPNPQLNWLSAEDIANFFTLAGFDVIKKDWRLLLPIRLIGLGSIINNYLAPWPFIRRACLRHYVVARSLSKFDDKKSPSATVLIPCRNEKGNIEAAIKRLPEFCNDLEIIFIEGHSKDGTLEEIKRVIDKYPNKDIKLLVQDGKGKGDAVRKGFANSRGDILMILDADLTTPPECMPKFYKAIASGRGEFINGTRLIYPMEDEAMQFLNHIANKIFSWLFSWLLNQRYTDTLCGTKVVKKIHYESIAKNRAYFGDFDPFGDFDLIFGAAKLNLKVVEIPVYYASRKYGETQISRFIHGFLLIKMVIFAYKKLKII